MEGRHVEHATFLDSKGHEKDRIQELLSQRGKTLLARGEAAGKAHEDFRMRLIRADSKECSGC